MNDFPLALKFKIMKVVKFENICILHFEKRNILILAFLGL